MRLSASAIPRLLVCQAAAVLPQARYQTSHADDGQDRHEEMESAVTRGDIASIPDAVRELVLDTHHTLEAAGALYAATGFVAIEPYNDNPNATRWYAKNLDAGAAS